MAKRYLTITEFLDYLAEHPADEWLLDKDGNLMDRNDYCPLWHVYHRRFETEEDEDEDEVEDYVNAGLRCGLRERDAIAIAQAADNRGHFRLRKRMLTTLGFESPPSSPPQKGPNP